MELYTWFVVSLLAIVTIIGIPGNILVLVVYANKTKRTGTRVFILGLAGVDLFICALSGYRFYLWINEESFSSDFVCRFFSWVGLASELSSAFVTTAVAVDRYLAICRPHLGWMTHRRAQVVCAVGITTSSIITIPTLAIYTMSSDSATGAQSCETTLSDAYRTWVYVALFVLAAAFASLMITALAMYMLLYREVRNRRKVRPSVIKAANDKDESTKSVHLGGMLVTGDSLIGISLTSKRLNSRRHSIGEAEGIAKKHGGPSNRKSVGSPVDIRMSFKEQLTATTKAGQHCPDKHGVNVTAIGSSSDDTGSDGPRTKLTTGHSEPSDEKTIKKANKSKTGKMLLLATVVFVVTWTARLLMWVISYMLHDKWTYLKEHDAVAFAFITLLQHLYYTTPAVNPAIYSFVNNKFREESMKVLRKMNLLRGSNM